MRVLGVLICSVLLTGCGALDALLDPPVIADLTVFNRTEMEILLLSAEGERLKVPACGQARDEDFRIDVVRVGADDLYVRSFGVGSDLAGQKVHLVELADGSASGIPALGSPPDPLPACDGVPQMQPGVLVEDIGR